MKKPFKYSIICDVTKRVILETNQEPVTGMLFSYVKTEDPSISILEKTKTAYIDTRYDAKLRLFNYITYTKKGLEIPKYKPFEGTEIGKTIPILNF